MLTLGADGPVKITQCPRGTQHPVVTPGGEHTPIDCPTNQHDPVRANELPGHDQVEVTEAAERGQIRRGEGSVVRVEVFWMASVGLPSSWDLDSRLHPGPGNRPTPSSVNSRETSPIIHPDRCKVNSACTGARELMSRAL